MDITLATANIKKAELPIIFAGIFRTSIPAVKLPTPAHTASKAVASDTKLGSRPGFDTVRGRGTGGIHF